MHAPSGLADAAISRVRPESAKRAIGEPVRVCGARCASIYVYVSELGTFGYFKYLHNK